MHTYGEKAQNGDEYRGQCLKGWFASIFFHGRRLKGYTLQGQGFIMQIVYQQERGSNRARAQGPFANSCPYPRTVRPSDHDEIADHVCQWHDATCVNPKTLLHDFLVHSCLHPTTRTLVYLTLQSLLETSSIRSEFLPEAYLASRLVLWASRVLSRSSVSIS